MSSAALYDLGATELLAAYRSHQLSPVDVTRAVLDRAAAWEPELHATYLLRPEAALAQARASEARWLRNAPQGLLDGVPITIKENIATQGDPTPLGTAAVELYPAPADAPPSARMREANAVLIAKTTMPDYGMLSSGLSSFHALTRNPWDLRKGPGGSSAGAGAACAAGYGPLHLGTDIGGSIRLPASWCGIFGLKPSLGRVPIDPPYTGRAAGPMTRTVADAALAMQVLSQPDARDSMNLPPQHIAWHEAANATPDFFKGKRIGLLLDAGCGLPLQDEVKVAIEHAAKLLEAAGAHVSPLKPFMTPEMLEGMDHFWRMRSFTDMRTLSADRRNKVLPFIRDWADSAANFSGTEVFDASQQFHLTRVATVRACNAFDFVISPVAPHVAFAAELPAPTNDPLRPLLHIGYTVPFNMSEQPASSINCGYTKAGLPIGLQIAGARFDDLGVLKASRAFEQIRDAQQPWPQPSA